MINRGEGGWGGEMGEGGQRYGNGGWLDFGGDHFVVYTNVEL